MCARSVNAVRKGKRIPRFVRQKISTRSKQWIPHEIGIQGSYDTGNVGDLAVGKSLKKELEPHCKDVVLFGKDVRYSNAKMNILGGGGVLHDWYGSNHLKRRLRYVSDGGLIIGVGVPGLYTERARKLLVNALPNIRAITVRDRRSRRKIEQICDADVEVTADPAFSYANPHVPSESRTGVNFRPWYKLDAHLARLDNYEEIMSYHFDYSEGLNHSRAKERYLQNIRTILKEVTDPVFIPFHEKDERFAREYLDVKVLDYEPSVEKTLRRVSSVEKMVTMRYHSLVFSAICQKPVLAINYDPKVGSLAERLDIPSYKPHESIPVEFSDVSNLEEMKDKNEENVRLIRDYLKE